MSLHVKEGEALFQGRTGLDPRGPEVKVLLAFLARGLRAQQRGDDTHQGQDAQGNLIVLKSTRPKQRGRRPLVPKLVEGVRFAVKVLGPRNAALLVFISGYGDWGFLSSVGAAHDFRKSWDMLAKRLSHIAKPPPSRRKKTSPR